MYDSEFLESVESDTNKLANTSPVKNRVNTQATAGIASALSRRL